MARTNPDVIDLRNGVDDLLDVAEAAAERYLALRSRAEVADRMRALEEMCSALDLVRSLALRQDGRVGALAS